MKPANRMQKLKTHGRRTHQVLEHFGGPVHSGPCGSAWAIWKITEMKLSRNIHKEDASTQAARCGPPLNPQHLMNRQLVARRQAALFSNVGATPHPQAYFLPPGCFSGKCLSNPSRLPVQPAAQAVCREEKSIKTCDAHAQFRIPLLLGPIQLGITWVTYDAMTWWLRLAIPWQSHRQKDCIWPTIPDLVCWAQLSLTVSYTCTLLERMECRIVSYPNPVYSYLLIKFSLERTVNYIHGALGTDPAFSFLQV